MKIKCVLFIFLTLLICASCHNPWMAEILGLKTITFDSNGGTNIASQTLCKNQTVIPPPNPSKSGHEFKGWYRDNETFEAAWDFKTVPTRDMTLYAKWEPTHTHQWGEWTVTAAATETTDGVETRTCSVCGETETRFSGEYATGTAGLSYALNSSAYSVSRGSVTSGTVHIPAYHRPDANSPYLPVTSIEDVAFDTLSITSITIPNSVMTIGSYAFDHCTSLASVTIGEGVTSIRDYAFSECTSLTSITIPASVTSINDNAFENCDSLTSVTFEGMIASGSFASNAFDGDLVTVYLGGGGGAGTYIRESGSSTWMKL